MAAARTYGEGVPLKVKADAMRRIKYKGLRVERMR